MQYINHPIVGDQKYGNIEVNKKFKNEFNLNYQLLHSSEIQFYNLDGCLKYLSNKKFKAKLPAFFENILKKL